MPQAVLDWKTCARVLSGALAAILDGVEPSDPCWEHIRGDLGFVLHTLHGGPELEERDEAASPRRRPQVEEDSDSPAPPRHQPQEMRSPHYDAEPDPRALDGTIELWRPPEPAPSWGGGPEGLAIRVGLLAAELEHVREGFAHLVGEGEEALQAIFERMQILHMRTCRIESVLDLPPMRPPDADTPRGANAQTPRSQDGEKADGPRVEEDEGDRLRCCLRGHPLRPVEETEVNGEAVHCDFCHSERPVKYTCSFDCPFHACSECIDGLPEKRGAEDEEPPISVPFQDADPERKKERPMSSTTTTTRPSTAGTYDTQTPSTTTFSEAEDDGTSQWNSADAGDEKRMNSFNFSNLSDVAPPQPGFQDEEPAGGPEAEDPSRTRRPRSGRPPRMRPSSHSSCPTEEAPMTPTALSGFHARLASLEEEVRALTARALETMGQENGMEEFNAVADSVREEFSALAARMSAVECRVEDLGSEQEAFAQPKKELTVRLSAVEDRCETLSLEHQKTLEGIQTKVQTLENCYTELGQRKGEDTSELKVITERIGLLEANCLEVTQQASSAFSKIEAFSARLAEVAGQCEQNGLLAQQGEGSLAAIEALGARLGAIEGRCGELSREVGSKSGGTAAAIEAVRSELQAALSTSEGALRQELETSLASMGKEFARCLQESKSEQKKEEKLVPDVSEHRLSSLETRMEALESELPRGRVRVLKNGQVRSEPESSNDVALHGLAQGLGSIARALGLARNGEELGKTWAWEEVGMRLDQAWLTRTRESWQLGLPTKADFFDLLQASRGNQLGSTSSSVATRLPDKREAARLAARLASSSPAGASSNSGFFAPPPAALADDFEDYETGSLSGTLSPSEGAMRRSSSVPLRGPPPSRPKTPLGQSAGDRVSLLGEDDEGRWAVGPNSGPRRPGESRNRAVAAAAAQQSGGQGLKLPPRPPLRAA